MPQPEIDHPPGASPVDFATTDKQGQKTIELLFRHPVSHSLAWLDVLTLFDKLGHVEERANGEFVFHADGEHHVMRRPYGKELTTPEVMELRQFMTRAGWSQRGAHPGQNQEAPTAHAVVPLQRLVVVDHHEARIYALDTGTEHETPLVILPYDPHHLMHHLTHKDNDAKRGQRPPEDPTFYERIAASIAGATSVTIMGHGKGHSNAAHYLIDYIHTRHHDASRRIVSETDLDLSAMTPPQLMARARQGLSQT